LRDAVAVAMSTNRRKHYHRSKNQRVLMKDHGLMITVCIGHLAAVAGIVGATLVVAIVVGEAMVEVGDLVTLKCFAAIL
jgi:hypothetical protein